MQPVKRLWELNEKWRKQRTLRVDRLHTNNCKKSHPEALQREAIPYTDSLAAVNLLEIKTRRPCQGKGRYYSPTMPTDAAPLSTEELRAEVEKLRVEVGAKANSPTREGGTGRGDEHALSLPRPLIGHRKLKYLNGDEYEGDTLDEMRHGRGKHFCANGDCYDGDWSYDKRDGTGKMVFRRGLVYEGEWKEDKTHGHGMCTYENGARYEGDFENDKRHGWGTLELQNGERYDGEWEEDCLHGKGRWTYSDGSYYEGEYSVGKRVKGRFVDGGNTMEYSGEFQDGARSGEGFCHLEGCFKYSGSWANDQRCGWGRCKYYDGSEYQGEWQRDMRNGRGRLKCPDGHHYEGEWKDDKPHGKGSCRYGNGDCYTGGFSEGHRHGFGCCASTNGDKYAGNWSGDKRNGKGKCLYALGDKYKGEWKDNMRHGQGVCLFADGTKFRGEWEEDSWLQTPANPKHTRLAGKGLTTAIAGQESVFFIEARDDQNNRRLTGGDTFQIVVKRADGSIAHGKTDDKGNGTYTARYTSAMSGKVELYILADEGELVGDSPYSIDVRSGPVDVKNCMVEGEGRKTAVRGELAEFHIVQRDQLGNACRYEETVPVKVSMAGGGEECHVQVQLELDGRYRCAYTPPESGFYRLEVECQGKHIAGCPFSILVSDFQDDELRPDHMCVKDDVSLWAKIAEEEYGKDGMTAGWDSDEDGHESSEMKFIKAHPDVPVVENLQDLWRLNKLQQARAKAAKAGQDP